MNIQKIPSIKLIQAAKHLETINNNIVKSEQTLDLVSMAYENMRKAKEKLRLAHDVQPVSTSLKDLGCCLVFLGKKSFGQALSDLSSSLQGFNNQELVQANELLIKANQQMLEAKTGHKENGAEFKAAHEELVLAIT